MSALEHSGPVVVVGASAAGLTTAEALRREGFEGQITLIGDEHHDPYDRPPLSKQVLAGDWTPEQTTLRPDGHLRGLDIDFRAGIAATGVDMERRRLVLEDGDRIPFGSLVIATGLRPRLPRSLPKLTGVHVLRTVEDAVALRDHATIARSAAVVGAGVLGCEVAASLRTLGLDVVIIDPMDRPMATAVDPRLAHVIAGLHEQNGVRLELGVGVSRLIGSSNVEAVELTDGRRRECDLVLIAVGSVPAVDWLAGSGIPVGDGVVCDSLCEAAPGVFAAGDVARWQDPHRGRHLRVEHRMHATEQAMHVARNIMGAAQPFAPTPYFWSDQFDLKLQSYGHAEPDADMELVEGELGSRRFVVRFVQEGRVTGIVGAGMPGQFRKARSSVATRSAVS